MSDARKDRRVEDSRYMLHCKPRLDKLESEYDTIDGKVDTIIAIVTNGLKDSVQDTKEQVKKIDNRVWLLLAGVIVSIGMQVLFKVIA